MRWRWLQRADRDATAFVLLALMLLPMVLVLVAGRQGPGMWSDSVNYAFGARSFAAVGEVNGWGGGPLTLWPPGFPILMSLPVSAGIDLEGAAVALNAVWVALTVLLTFALAKRTLQSSSLALLAAGVVSSSASTMRVFAWFASETPFIVLTLVALLLCVDMCQSRAVGWARIMALGAVIALASFVRLAGAWLIPVALVSVVFASWPRGWRPALTAAAVTTVLSGSGIGAVVLRNVNLGAPPFGSRRPTDYTLLNLISGSVATVGRYAAAHSWTISAIAVGLVMVLLFGYSAVAAWRRRAPAVGMLCVFTALYWILLTWSQVTTSINPTSARLAAPAFTPLVIVLIDGVRDIHRRLEVAMVVRPQLGGVRRAARLATGALVGSVLAISVVESVTYTNLAVSEGLGYNSVTSRTSELALSLKDLPSDARIAATDDAKAAWVSGRHLSLRIVRPRGAAGSTAHEEAVRGTVDQLREGAIDYVAFFTDSENPSGTPYELLAGGARIRLAATFIDGTLWEVWDG